MPELDFRVEGAEVVEFAAAPTLAFKLQIASPEPVPIRSMLVKTQIRIEPAQRAYAPAEEAGLTDLFGPPSRWGETLRSLLWAQTTLLVPSFTGDTVVDLPVPCTYDFEVASAKYFHALEAGAVPLEFLFSGTVFYAGAVGLQAVQIPWDREARFRLPVALWKQMMDHYFPDSAWIRLRRDAFARLNAFRARHQLPSWEAALDRLLDGTEGV